MESYSEVRLAHASGVAGDIAVSTFVAPKVSRNYMSIIIRRGGREKSISLKGSSDSLTRVTKFNKKFKDRNTLPMYASRCSDTSCKQPRLKHDCFECCIEHLIGKPWRRLPCQIPNISWFRRIQRKCFVHSIGKLFHGRGKKSGSCSITRDNNILFWSSRVVGNHQQPSGHHLNHTDTKMFIPHGMKADTGVGKPFLFDRVRLVQHKFHRVNQSQRWH